MSKLKAVVVGAGYFSRFHYEAWTRIPEVDIVAACDLDASRVEVMCKEHDIPRSYTSFAEMLDTETPDFVDIVTPPATHLELCREAAQRKVHIICQKALAPDFETAQAIVEVTSNAGIRFMVHENFRFQPWHREIKKLLERGVIGGKLFNVLFRMRQGDGWGEDAYLDRQPYFREMEQLLVYETGIHFIDTFRYLAGEVSSVYAQLSRLNPVIAGEDAGIILFQFENGATGLWDANRYNESNHPNPRYTFGEFLVEGDQGSIRLYSDGRLTVQPLGKPETDHAYAHEDKGFAGDCVYAAQRHFIDQYLADAPFETGGDAYLKSLRVQEAIYESAKTHLPVTFPA
jgi:predicted dehydrogenase